MIWLRNVLWSWIPLRHLYRSLVLRADGNSSQCHCSIPLDRIRGIYRTAIVPEKIPELDGTPWEKSRCCWALQYSEASVKDVVDLKVKSSAGRGSESLSVIAV
jgi:hypothetical protein